MHIKLCMLRRCLTPRWVLGQELKQLMAVYGGTFDTYYSRQRVTHIICSHLTDAKVKLFAKARCAIVWTPLPSMRLVCA